MTNEIPTLRDPQDRRLPRISPPCGLVIFGITGDLARKKLLPAIYDLANRGLLHPAFSLTGFARRDWSPQDFEEYVRASIEAHTRTGFNEGTWNQLRSGLRFVSGTFDDPEAYRRLAETVAELDHSRGTGGNHAFYLSIPPSYFPVVAKHLSDTGLNKRQGREWRRVIIEKPFGHNLESARELSDVISQIFDEQDVFRIDHYLGKETVQNIMQCASPTPCSSRCGRPTTSIPCRSRWPRTSASARVRATTTVSERRATSSRTTCFS